MIKLHKLKNSYKNPKNRVGRGIAAGRGKTAGRGTKGQKSRKGRDIPRRFVGGEIPLIQRLPKKRGFKHRGLKTFAISTRTLEKYFQTGDLISPETLIKKGLINKNLRTKIKIINSGLPKTTFKYIDVKISKSLQESLKTPKTPEKSLD